MDCNQSAILTKIHSSCNEGVSKVRWLRNQGVKQSIILVPYMVKKTDMVDVCGNILVDDCLENLDDWVCANGIPLFFDINNDDYDSYCGAVNNIFVHCEVVRVRTIFSDFVYSGSCCMFARCSK